MSRRAAVIAAPSCSSTCPTSCGTDRSRRGSLRRLDALIAALRSYDEAVAYPPNQVFIGSARARLSMGASSQLVGAPGRRRDFRRLLRRRDATASVLRPARRGGSIRPRAAWTGRRVRTSSCLTNEGEPVGAFAGDHEADESLTAAGPAREPGGQGQRRARPAGPARSHRRRPGVDHTCHRLRRGGRRRPIPARRRQRREGDRRGVRARARERAST